MKQRSLEWFAARLGKATASKFADVMAKTKSAPAATRKNYAAQLVLERITSKQAESYQNQAMLDGIEREPIARMTYELATGRTVQEVGFIDHSTINMCGCSPDGLVGDDGLIEIKCPIDATHLETLLGKQFPSKYQAQVQGQLAITNRQWCDFVSFNPNFPDHLQMFVIRVERDDSFIAELEFELRSFLNEVDSTVQELEAMK